MKKTSLLQGVTAQVHGKNSKYIKLKMENMELEVLKMANTLRRI